MDMTPDQVRQARAEIDQRLDSLERMARQRALDVEAQVRSRAAAKRRP